MVTALQHAGRTLGGFLPAPGEKHGTAVERPGSLLAGPPHLRSTHLTGMGEALPGNLVQFTIDEVINILDRIACDEEALGILVVLQLLDQGHGTIASYQIEIHPGPDKPGLRTDPQTERLVQHAPFTRMGQQIVHLPDYFVTVGPYFHRIVCGRDRPRDHHAVALIPHCRRTQQVSTAVQQIRQSETAGPHDIYSGNGRYAVTTGHVPVNVIHISHCKGFVLEYRLVRDGIQRHFVEGEASGTREGQKQGRIYFQ